MSLMTPSEAQWYTLWGSAVTMTQINFLLGLTPNVQVPSLSVCSVGFYEWHEFGFVHKLSSSKWVNCCISQCSSICFKSSSISSLPYLYMNVSNIMRSVRHKFVNNVCTYQHDIATLYALNAGERFDKHKQAGITNSIFLEVGQHGRQYICYHFFNSCKSRMNRKRNVLYSDVP